MTNGHRGLGLLLALYFIAYWYTFSPAAPAPMTDLPRSCFSVLGLLFTDRYLQHRRVYYLVMAGLVAGAAVAGKYTEFITLALIGTSLMPLLLQERKVWFHALGFGSDLCSLSRAIGTSRIGCCLATRSIRFFSVTRD